MIERSYKKKNNIPLSSFDAMKGDAFYIPDKLDSSFYSVPNLPMPLILVLKPSEPF